MRDIHDPPNHLKGAIHRRVRYTIFQLAIANERLQHRHVDRIPLQGSLAQKSSGRSTNRWR
jgi:hypothetical protein